MFYALVKERKVPLWIVLPALALIPLAGLALALMLFGVALEKSPSCLQALQASCDCV